MIAMITENGTTKTKCVGDRYTLTADSALIALNACRLYIENTSKAFTNKQAAALDLMQTVLLMISKEGDET